MTTKTDRQALLARISKLVETGKFKKAWEEIYNIKYHDLDPKLTTELMKQMRLTANPMGALRIYFGSTQARNSKSQTEAMPDALILEYVRNLLSLGFSQLATNALQGLLSPQDTEALYVRAHCFWSETDYVSAVDILGRLLTNKEVSEDLKKRAQGKMAECLCLLGEHSQPPPKDLLHTSSLIRSFYEIYQILQGGGSRERVAAGFRVIGRKAIENEDYLIAQEMEVLELAITKNREKATELYFGTLYPKVRERILNAIGESWTVPEVFILGNAEGTVRKFDLLAGYEIQNPSVHLKPGKVIHRLFCALVLSSKYGISLAQIHETVFQNLPFELNTSPTRIHQIIRRLKRWLEHHHIPLSIQEKNSRYFLMARAPYQIQIHRDLLGVPLNKSICMRIKLKMNESEFGSRDLAKRLGITQRFASVLLNQGVDEGIIQIIGKGRSTKYKIIKDLNDTNH